MKVIDISRPLLHAPVYPGDPAPRLERLTALETGDDFTTSALYACLHNGTHLDAPAHALPDAPDVRQLPADTFLGECTVIPFEGCMTGQQAENLLAQLRRPTKRLLLKGRATLTVPAAAVLADAGLCLLGTESASVADGADTLATHRLLLEAGVALLEGLDLSGAQPDRYFLVAPPLPIEGAEASPVRALLVCRDDIDWHEGFWK